MKNLNFLSPAFVSVLCGLAIASLSCRKKEVVKIESVVPVYEVAPELLSNQLEGVPGAVYASQVDSPIHWQPWTKESLERARNAGRLIFCVIAMPQQPDFERILALLAGNPAVVDAINSFYVPVLVDGDAAREMGLLTADLCSEIKKPLQLPLLLWMTPDVNPVAWIPATSRDAGRLADLFFQSHSMVKETWENDPAYVKNNSTVDNAQRRARIEQRKIANVVSEDPATDVVRSIRRLASLYDPYSRSFDEAGGLFPASSIELMAAAAVHPGLPDEVRSRCVKTTRNLMEDLLQSAMFDPLDGGVFMAKRANSWSLPAFVRGCPVQARVAVALLQAYRATGDPKVKEVALGLIRFAEISYGTPEGLFSVGFEGVSDPVDWMWSVEEIEKLLPAEDARWWIKATGMRGLGNLPSETDPLREYFRENTLSLSKTVAEIAAAESQPEEEFALRFESVREKLLEVRNKRLGEVSKDSCSHASSTFRMVSAYAAAFGATGDEEYRTKAVDLLTRSREAFGDGQKLRNFSKESAPPVGAGRAFLYAVALQAALDVATITSDDQWLIWSEDLATTAAELFTGDGFLKECPDDAKLIDLPVTDLLMLFDDSTAGLVSMAECRLEELGRPLMKSFSELATPMPLYSLDRPILHTDLLLATLARHFKVVVVAGEDISAEMKNAIQRLPMRVIQRRPARSDDEMIRVGSVKVILPGGESRLVDSPAALEEAVLPSPVK
jgi:uncharacterized protein YyaL (SSP411 family)